jgi:hypothetical protein
MKKKQQVILENHGTIQEEFLCHFPYAILSVALSIIALSFLSYFGIKIKESRQLFHSFHFLHILFAGTGTVLAFRKFSENKLAALVVGLSVPTVFCTLSDSLLPFLGGWYLGLGMHFHWCFIKHLNIVVPFLIVGVINGFIVGSHKASMRLYYSASSHFLHIFVSSLASILYLVSYGFANWSSSIGFVFLFLIGAVLVPCTLSDLVVPMYFARYEAKRNFGPLCTGCHGDREEKTGHEKHTN